MKVGTIDTASNDFAKIPFTNPASEKMSAARNAATKIMNTLKMTRCVKKSDTPITSTDTNSARTIPPDTKPAITTQLGSGDTKSSSR